MPAEKSSLKLKKTEILQTSHQTIFAIALLSDSWNYCIYFQLINTSKHRLELFCFLFVPSILFPSLFVVVVCFLPFFFSSFKLVHHSQCISQFFSERYFFPAACIHPAAIFIISHSVNWCCVVSALVRIVFECMYIIQDMKGIMIGCIANEK